MIINQFEFPELHVMISTSGNKTFLRCKQNTQNRKQLILNTDKNARIGSPARSIWKDWMIQGHNGKRTRYRFKNNNNNLNKKGSSFFVISVILHKDIRILPETYFIRCKAYAPHCSFVGINNFQLNSCRNIV